MQRIALVIVMLFTGVCAWGQTITGAAQFTSQTTNGFGSTNLGSLNVHFEVPIVSKAGRGIPFNYSLAYDSSIWAPNGTGSTGTKWQPMNAWGWGASTTQPIGGYVKYKKAQRKCIPLYEGTQAQAGNALAERSASGRTWYYYYVYTYYSYVDRGGVSHPLGLTLDDDRDDECSPYPSWGSITSNDGSGLKLTAYLGGNTATITTPEGTRFAAVLVAPLQQPPTIATPTVAQDSNGNKITTPDGGVTFIDTLNTTALKISGTNPVIYEYLNPAGGYSPVKVHYSTQTVMTNFGCSGVDEYGPTAVSLISSIELPDGTGSYTFEYEPTPGYQQYVTGRIRTVTLPTGGQVTYSYPGANNGVVCSDGSASALRTTVTPGGEWNYSRSLLSGTNWLTTATDPAGNQTLINFQRVSRYDGSMYLETKRVVKNGSATVLQTTETCYNTTTPDCTAVSVIYPILNIRVLSRLPDATGRTSQRFTTYDLGDGRPTALSEYDFGSLGSGWSSGSHVRKTVVSYDHLGTNVSRLSSVQVYDGNDNLKAQTKFTYDEGNTAATSAQQHDAVSGARGNATTISRWVSGNRWLTQRFSYFDTGLVQTATDSNNASTTYTYGACESAFPTRVDLPLNLHRTADWNCNGGAQNWSADENDRRTSYSYDNLWRPVQISRPDGGWTSYTYTPSEKKITRTDAIDGSKSLTTLGYYDGLGRTTETQVTSDPDGAIRQITEYDNAGRVWRVSNNFRSTSDPTYGITEYSYDALGRTSQVRRPDNNTVLYGYSGAATSVQDEGNGIRRVQKVYQNDGLGRLTSVCEVTSIALMGISNTPANCQFDFSGSGFVTTYQYDTLDNLTRVVQGGLNNRVLSYDGISRLTSETIPEAANSTVTYNYDDNGNLSQRIRPTANQTDPAVNTTTTYTWDALHRNTGISYNDGTPSVSFHYDEAAAWGTQLSNPLGRLTSQYTSSNSTITSNLFSYDPMGRMTLYGECTPATCSGGAYTTNYTYDYLGNATSFTNGRGVTFSGNYDAAARLSSLTSSLNDPQHPGTLISGIHYNALGQLTSGTLGNGVGLNRSYNSRGLPNSVSDGSIWSLSDVSYKPNGNLASANDSVNGNWSYTYDDFNRLKTASKSGESGVGLEYVYDRYGNRWQQNVTRGGPAPQPQYSFDANNRITGSGISYDALGNVTNDGAHSYTYDAENRMTRVDNGGTAAYTYDADGHRVQAVTQAGTRDFILDPAGRTVASVDPVNNIWIRGEVWSPVGYVATYVNSTTYFNHTDWLGTIRARSDTSGNPAESFTNLPFGDSLSSMGISPVHFTGQERDQETGLDHFWFRQYSSTQGRWMSPDPAGLEAGDLADPQTLNRYAYVADDPATLFDPDGLNLAFYVDGVEVSASQFGFLIASGAAYPSFTAAGACSQDPRSGTVWCGGDRTGEGRVRYDPMTYLAWLRGNLGTNPIKAISIEPAANANTVTSAKDQCLAGYYNSRAGKLIDFGSMLGMVPGWSPNASKNLKELLTLGAMKYGGLKGTELAANKWDVLTIRTINTTTTMSSSAGAGLSVGLHWLGKAATVGTVFATGLDVLIHSGCDSVARQQAGTMTPIYPTVF